MTIPFPEFNRDSALLMLGWGANPEVSPFTHREIASWCDQFWCLFLDADVPREMEVLLQVLGDVDCQWDLYLANTYTFEELRVMDLDKVRLPAEWFQDWAKQIGA
jgi:hypothetical protein